MYQRTKPQHEDLLSASTRPSVRSHVVKAKDLPQQHRVRPLPDRNAVPLWLTYLLAMQRGALVVFCSVLGLSALGYGYTVYTQDSWKSQHGQLRRLQLQERQQTVMNENLKQEMAKKAEEPASGLVAPNPERIVFIPIAPQRPAKALPSHYLPQPAPTSKLPRGY
ncbi:hypothetical protein [Chamaesiphon minutus]|uniref:Cell division protein FtsL n=1 Tax=Chamaesiphon minutus (strain ATCC 27169 / PCC 6605) TaxID=1173020 RepID=K9UMB2_CHAP6|nr:hypothetical protein [Chamaesiphon minutus]AFY96252.1 hypothetical protein Cha6605_5365 [Chamaesiphon minutus PCC 6605]